MNLTANQLMESIIAITEGANRLPNHEKRNAPRISMCFRVTFKPVIDAAGNLGPARSAWLKDISSSGLGLVIDEPLEDGSSFVAELPTLHGGLFEILCLCCHCHKTEQGEYQVGSQFFAEWNNPFERPILELEALET